MLTTRLLNDLQAETKFKKPNLRREKVKRIFYIVLPMLVFISVTSLCAAADLNCTVKSIDENTVTLDCGKKATKLQQGDKVKVREKKKRKQINGC